MWVTVSDEDDDDLGLTSVDVTSANDSAIATSSSLTPTEVPMAAWS